MYEIHELANIVPMASVSEQATLTEDIRRNGLYEPILLWKGKIVDGRCRQKACLSVGERMRTKELDENLSENDVEIIVKSLNTRRNLTTTQKIMSASRESLTSNKSRTLTDIAKSWGVSLAILQNARYISKVRPEFVEPLFNGQAVEITDAKGHKVKSTKVSAVYASIKREEQNVKEDIQHGWNEDSIIKTQAGKDWYYEQLALVDIIGQNHIKYLLMELANYKFQESHKDNVNHNTDHTEGV